MNWLYLRKTPLFQAVFVVFILHVSTDAQGHGPKCSLFKVQRGAVHKAYINKPFKISCNLKYCDDQTINITWSKDNLEGWIPVSGTGQMSTSQIYSAPDLLTSYLTFTNISKNHDGLYRCELQLPNMSTFSHSINISVSDDSLGDEMAYTEMTTETTQSDNTDSSSDSKPWWMPYLFLCMGVVILVLIVMLTSILCIIGFKTLRRKNTQKAHVEYTDLLKCDEFVCVQYSEETLTTTHPALTPEVSTLFVSFSSDDPLYMRDNCLSQVVYPSLFHQ